MDSTRLPIRPDVGAYTASGHTAAFRLFASAKNARRIAKFMKCTVFSSSGVVEYNAGRRWGRNGMEIVKIREQAAWIEDASEMFHSVWGVPREAYIESMRECLRRQNGVPQWYLAVDNSRLAGGLGVIEKDFHSRGDLTPNVCALYVRTAYRRRGIAGRLLDCACADMAGFGIGTLYLITEHTSFFEKYGWRFLCMVQEEGTRKPIRMYRHGSEC